MIGEADEQIAEWARAVVPDVTVNVGPPPQKGNGEGIYLTLLSIAAVAAPRAMRRAPRELALDYLVSTAGQSVSGTHDWLGALAFAALDVATWKVVTEPLPLQLWQAFEVTPRPAFVVRVPLRLDREEENVPLVRRPLEVAASQIAHLSGDVIGPDATPIAGAKVEVPALQLFARTDENGAFHFPTVPADAPVSVIVRAKGHVSRIRASAGQRLRVELSENDLEG